MDRESLKEIINEELEDIRFFIKMYEDVPIIAATINQDVKDILDSIKKNEERWEKIKLKQASLQNSIEKLQRLKKLDSFISR